LITKVVKIGGAALADPSWMESFAKTVSESAERLVVVHGGGPEINALSERIGLEVQWSNGRRVTPPEALDVASMVLTGRLNKRIVSALLDAGADAIGLSGEDGALIEGDLAEGGQLGRVGTVVHVRRELIDWLVGRGMTPVISPISRGPDGRPVNINADEVAAAVATHVGAPELIFITDVRGVLDADGTLRRALSGVEAQQMIASETASGGMALKLRTALAALEAGVASVRIGSFETLLDAAAGTRISPGSEVIACP
jgi:acetylglutamate kinase